VHSCSENLSGHYCSEGYRDELICSHYCCGDDCNYDCVSFVCDVCCLDVTGDAEKLLVHAKLYEMADKYDIAGLRLLCIEKYKRACNNFWNDTKFAASAYHVYCTTPT
jgi:hypothetical protein